MSRELKSLAWGKRVSPEFRERVIQLCRNLEWPVETHADWLMACMAFETGRKFSSSVKNPGSSACVDIETEILTANGWKRYDEVSVGENIYSLNFDSWLIEIDRIYDLIVKESDNNYRISSRSLDAVTTHDHRWYLEKRDYNGPTTTYKIVEKTTEELFRLKSNYLYSIIHPSNQMIDKVSGLCPYPDPLLTLLGMIVGDGSISKKRRLIELNCPIGTKKHRLGKECVSALFDTGPVWDEKGNGMARCRFNKEASESLLGFFDWEYNETLAQSRFVKKLHPRIFRLLDYGGAQALIKGYMITDGHHHAQNDTSCFRNAERAVLDDFQQVAILAGYNPREVVNRRGGSDHTFPNGSTYKVKDIYTVWLRKHNFTSCNRKQLIVEPLNETITVWCPTTGNHNWIARRSGTVYITGNCGLIQFMAATARVLGTTTAKLAAMSEVEQLGWVERYFRPNSRRIKTLEDMYMAILWPSAIGRTKDAVLWRKGTVQYQANSGLDTNRNGFVTVGEAAGKVREQLNAGRLPENLWVAEEVELEPLAKEKPSALSDPNQLSKNFWRSEFACKCGCGTDHVKPELIDVLQEMRNIVDKPIEVNSGVRCADHNRRVGGASKSKHLLGEAADIKVAGMTPKQVAAVAKQVLGNRGGIKVYKTFTHVDVRPEVWHVGI